MIAICLEGVSKRYGLSEDDAGVFEGADLNLPAAELAVLMGPSGSGKSTLLNLIGGLDRPDTGRITVFGTDVVGLSRGVATQWRRTVVGYVFQDAALIETLTVGENIALPMLHTGASRRERSDRTDSLLDVVGLAGFSERRPRTLSRGQAQRVALARALGGTPRLLLCDEPTGNLDRANAETLMGLLRTAVDVFGVTVLVASHDPLVAGYGDRTISIRNGGLTRPGIDADVLAAV